jgi:hypothetical protein
MRQARICGHGNIVPSTIVDRFQNSSNLYFQIVSIDIRWAFHRITEDPDHNAYFHPVRIFIFYV